MVPVVQTSDRSFCNKVHSPPADVCVSSGISCSLGGRHTKLSIEQARGLHLSFYTSGKQSVVNGKSRRAKSDSGHTILTSAALVSRTARTRASSSCCSVRRPRGFRFKLGRRFRTVILRSETFTLGGCADVFVFIRGFLCSVISRSQRLSGQVPTLFTPVTGLSR